MKGCFGQAIENRYGVPDKVDLLLQGVDATPFHKCCGFFFKEGERAMEPDLMIQVRDLVLFSACVDMDILKGTSAASQKRSNRRNVQKNNQKGMEKCCTITY